ncbi:AAA family ATPase [Ponticoccus litoralis]|uniref:AAA family ATPase n=1 Tax=Ponticoccus litoralis TaxID=422297 RepID=A0AAW9SBK5_9RHOB
MSSRAFTRSGYRALLIEYRDSDYNAHELCRRLEQHYRTLRQRRHDRRRAAIESGLEDPYPQDEFLGDGEIWIPSDVRSRIERRVKLYQERRVDLAGIGHLRASERTTIKKLTGGVRVSHVDEAIADEIAASLHDQFPWMSAATDIAWQNLRLSAKRGTPARVGPLILDGPPGIGKSAWARHLAYFLSAPSTEIDAGASNASFSVAGVERGFNSAEPGRPIQAIIQHHHAGPIIVVDEIDKAGQMHSSRGGRISLPDALLGLLEPNTAERWTCPAYRLPFDLSAISWILTSNDLQMVAQPLLSRCDIVRCPPLRLEQILTFASRECHRRDLSVPAKEAALEALDQFSMSSRRPVDLRDVNRLLDRAAALQARPMLH